VIELLTLFPCPFCRSSRLGVVQIDAEEGETMHVVRCYHCRAEGPVAADAVSGQLLWNKRPTERR
jgi:transcription elongation factor Elf1